MVSTRTTSARLPALLGAALIAFGVSCRDAGPPVAPRPFGPSAAVQSAGGQIAFSSDRDGDDEIYVMNPDGSGVTRLTNSVGSDLFPTWSPDGSRIAFTSYRDGNAEIYVMNADGTGVTRLTTNAVHDESPAWAPTGARIAFQRGAAGQLATYDVYVMNADGTGVTRLTNNLVMDADPDWSPDGSRITFTSARDGNDEIYAMNADGTGVARLTNVANSDYNAAWSPDGSRIAFASFRDGNAEVYVMNADGTGAIRLTNNAAIDQVPDWSPSGTQIVFESARDGDLDIHVMNGNGTGVIQLTSNTTTDMSAAWSGASTGGVVFESNWTTALGATEAAIKDLNSPTPWDIWEDGSQGTLQGGAHIMEVVSGIAPPGYTRSLRVQQRGGCADCWADVRKNPFIATGGTDYYLRYYFRTDDIGGTAIPRTDHGVEPWINSGQYEDLVYLSKIEDSPGWGLKLRIGGNGPPLGDPNDRRYPVGWWFLTTSESGPLPLSYNTWYRLEYWVHFIDATHMQVHVRVYEGGSTTPLFDDGDFRQQDYGSATGCAGLSDWTLELWYTRTGSACNPDGTFEVNGFPDHDGELPDQAGTTLQSLTMGNNGQDGAANTGLFWYYAGVQIRTDTWPGP